MRKFFLTIALLLLVAFLSGCSSKEVELWIYNGTDSISNATITAFEKEYNVKVVYNTYDLAEDAYAYLTKNPDKYDVFFAPNYITTRLIQENALLPIDKTQIANYSNIMAGFIPFTTYTMPYMTGTWGILYNSNKTTTPINSWNALWDPRYKSEILMTYSQREAIAISLLSCNLDMNDKAQNDIDLAQSKLQDQFKVVQSYQTINAPDNMAWGRAILAAVPSNAAQMAIEKSKDTNFANLAYVIPNEGSVRWISSMVIPKQAKNPALALKFIDFMSRPENSSQNSIATGMTSVIDGTKALLPADMQNSLVMYTSAADDNRCKYLDYDVSASQKYEQMWRLIKASMASIWKK